MYVMYIQEIVQRAKRIQWTKWAKDRKKQFTKRKITSKQVNRKIFTNQNSHIKHQ